MGTEKVSNGANPSQTNNQDAEDHTVKAGESLWKIYDEKGRPGSWQKFVQDVVDLNPGRFDFKTLANGNRGAYSVHKLAIGEGLNIPVGAVQIRKPTEESQQKTVPPTGQPALEPERSAAEVTPGSENSSQSEQNPQLSVAQGAAGSKQPLQAAPERSADNPQLADAEDNKPAAEKITPPTPADQTNRPLAAANKPEEVTSPLPEPATRSAKLPNKILRFFTNTAEVVASSGGLAMIFGTLGLILTIALNAFKAFQQLSGANGVKRKPTWKFFGRLAGAIAPLLVLVAPSPFTLSLLLPGLIAAGAAASAEKMQKSKPTTSLPEKSA